MLRASPLARCWLGGDIPGSRDDLIDNLTTLWLITGDGAAAHAQTRAPSRTPRR